MASIYIHIPFCVKKCHYCSFYSIPYDPQSADRFASALLLEAEGQAGLYSKRFFDTAFIGGGTPSVFSLSQFRNVAESMRKLFHFVEGAEFTVEVNPHSGSGRIFTMMLDGGVNRLSLGVQSYSDRLLQALGRPHNAALAREAFANARESGFTNIGIDLIYGIPGQSTLDWQKTLEIAIAQKPQHISCYSLSLDEGSYFAQAAAEGCFQLPDDDVVVRQYELGVNQLADSGYCQYEISNFALPGFECRHNVNYWNRGEYLGLGPGASSFVSNRRFQTKADWKTYCARLESGLPLVKEEEQVGPAEAALETVMLGLRMNKGIELARFSTTFGEALLNRLLLRASPMVKTGLMSFDAGHLSLTNRGMVLSNEALARLA